MKYRVLRIFILKFNYNCKFKNLFDIFLNVFIVILLFKIEQIFIQEKKNEWLKKIENWYIHLSNYINNNRFLCIIKIKIKYIVMLILRLW